MSDNFLSLVEEGWSPEQAQLAVAQAAGDGDCLEPDEDRAPDVLAAAELDDLDTPLP